MWRLESSLRNVHLYWSGGLHSLQVNIATTTSTVKLGRADSGTVDMTDIIMTLIVSLNIIIHHDPNHHSQLEHIMFHSDVSVRT